MITRLLMIGGPYNLHELPGAGSPSVMQSFLGLPSGWNPTASPPLNPASKEIPPAMWPRYEQYDYRLTMIVEEHERRIAVYAFAGTGCSVRPPFESPWLTIDKRK